MKYADESQVRTLANSGRITHAQAAAARSELRGDTIAPREEKHPRVDLRKPRRWVKMFQFGFVTKLRSGTKTTTIRPLPKRAQDWPKAGDIIDARHWFAKPYRSPQMAILTARIRRVVEVHLYDFGIIIKNRDGSREGLNAKAHSEAVDAIAKADGFDSWDHLATWFRATHGLPFEGILIEWEVAS